MGIFNVTEQRLVDQKKKIFKRIWLRDLELEEIQRYIEDIEHGEVLLASDEEEGRFLEFDHERQDVFMKESEVVLQEYMVPNVE